MGATLTVRRRVVGSTVRRAWPAGCYAGCGLRILSRQGGFEVTARADLQLAEDVVQVPLTNVQIGTALFLSPRTVELRCSDAPAGSSSGMQASANSDQRMKRWIANGMPTTVIVSNRTMPSSVAVPLVSDRHGVNTRQ
jgi:hypothetical protein